MVTEKVAQKAAERVFGKAAERAMTMVATMDIVTADLKEVVKAVPMGYWKVDMSVVRLVEKMVIVMAASTAHPKVA